MIERRIDALARSAAKHHARRETLKALGAATLVAVAGTPLDAITVARPFASASARKKRKGKNRRRCKNCCRANGQSCRKKSKSCHKKFCAIPGPALPDVGGGGEASEPDGAVDGDVLSAPLTIEAHWVSERDHDTYVFVPNATGASLPSPYINFACGPGRNCGDDVYPFICVSQDARGPGDEVTTVRTLLPGVYEYWIEIYSESVAGDVTVTLRDTNERVVRTWSSPANPDPDDTIGWHVFDLDGKTGKMSSVDRTIDEQLPEGHEPCTDVCLR